MLKIAQQLGDLFQKSFSKSSWSTLSLVPPAKTLADFAAGESYSQARAAGEKILRGGKVATIESMDE